MNGSIFGAARIRAGLEGCKHTLDLDEAVHYGCARLVIRPAAIVAHVPSLQSGNTKDGIVLDHRDLNTGVLPGQDRLAVFLPGHDDGLVASGDGAEDGEPLVLFERLARQARRLEARGRCRWAWERVGDK